MIDNKEIRIFEHVSELIRVHRRCFHKRIVLSVIHIGQDVFYRIQFPEAWSSHSAGESVGDIIFVIDCVVDADVRQKIVVISFDITEVGIVGFPYTICNFISGAYLSGELIREFLFESQICTVDIFVVDEVVWIGRRDCRNQISVSVIIVNECITFGIIIGFGFVEIPSNRNCEIIF